MKKEYLKVAGLGFEISSYIISSLILGNIIGNHYPSTKGWIIMVLILLGFTGWVIRVIKVTSKKD